jgi:hypothetical protein
VKLIDIFGSFCDLLNEPGVGHLLPGGDGILKAIYLMISKIEKDDQNSGVSYH